jgi:fucose permease
MLSDLGYVLGPVALGAVTDLRGADAALTTAAALMLAAAALFARFAPESYHGPRP